MITNYEKFGTPLWTSDGTPDSVRFSLINTNATIANTLRRAILMDTRSVGFRADLTNAENPGVVIRKNTTVIFNEMLAQRLTLLPLGIINIDTFNPENYECILHVKNETRGPITTASTRNVTASDFTVREKRGDGTVVELPDAATATMFPKNPLTGHSSLLTVLRSQWNPAQPPEEIDLTAYPVISTGREFMGFSPVSQCSFQNTLDTDPVRQEAFFADWVSTYKKVTDPGTLTPEQRDTFRAEWETMAVQRCFKVGADGQANEFTFTVESVGVRPPADIVAEGIQAIITLLTPYANEAASMADLQISVQPVDSRINGINLIFEGQDHTLGNLLQTLITEMYQDPDSPITFAGYKIRHPLMRNMTLTIGIREGVAGDSAAIARQAITEAAKRALKIFTDMAAAWRSLTV